MTSCKQGGANLPFLSNKLSFRENHFGTIDRYPCHQCDQVIRSCKSRLFSNQRNGTTLVSKIQVLLP